MYRAADCCCFGQLAQTADRDKSADRYRKKVVSTGVANSEIMRKFSKMVNVYRKTAKIKTLVWYYINSKIRVKKDTRNFYDRLYKWQYLKYFNTDKYNKDSFNTTIDVLIPVIERDLDVLKYCIASLRKHSLNPIQNIYLIAPDNLSIRKFAESNGCQFIDERTVTAIKKGGIKYRFQIFDRSGWLFQQLLKLNWDNVSKNKYCLILDSDTLLTSPHVFIQNGILRFNCSDEYHKTYFDTFYKMFGYEANYNLSFVSHYMLFERETTKMMKNEIEHHTGVDWEEAVLKHCNYNDVSGFSEYETYANYMLKRHKSMMKINYWFNRSMNIDKLNADLISEIEQQRDSKSLSFHWYKDQVLTICDDRL